MIKNTGKLQWVKGPDHSVQWGTKKYHLWYCNVGYPSNGRVPQVSDSTGLHPYSSERRRKSWLDLVISWNGLPTMWSILLLLSGNHLGHTGSRKPPFPLSLVQCLPSFPHPQLLLCPVWQHLSSESSLNPSHLVTAWMSAKQWHEYVTHGTKHTCCSWALWERSTAVSTALDWRPPYVNQPCSLLNQKLLVNC